MKKFMLSVVVLAAATVFLMPSKVKAAPYGMAGCGVGALLFEDHPGKLQQIVAWLVNQYFYQSFSITSGTSNCVESGALRAQAEQEVYIASNLDSLQADIAKGEGEHLSNLAFLMGCPAEMEPVFAKTAQQNYDVIFQDGQSDDEYKWVHYRLKEMVRHDKTLNAACHGVMK